MVRAQARTAPLGQVARLLTQRRRVELRDETGRKLAELDDDVVSVMDGRRLAARFRQVEFEVDAAASEVLIVEVLNRLTLAGAVAGDDRPKVVRALGPRASLGPDVVVPELGPKATVSAVVSAAIATGLTRIVRHDPGVRLGDDPEHVHQARVGTRRLRSDLRTFRQLLDPDWAGPIRDELGWLGAALGEVRDADVLTGRLRSQLRALPDVDARPSAALLRRLAIQRDAARGRMLEALNSQRYVTLLEGLARAAADPPLAHPAPVLAAVTPSQRGRQRQSPGASPIRIRIAGPPHAVSYDAAAAAGEAEVPTAVSRSVGFEQDAGVPLGGAVVDPASGEVPVPLGGGGPIPAAAVRRLPFRRLQERRLPARGCLEPARIGRHKCPDSAARGAAGRRVRRCPADGRVGGRRRTRRSRVGRGRSGGGRSGGGRSGGGRSGGGRSGGGRGRQFGRRRRPRCIPSCRPPGGAFPDSGRAAGAAGTAAGGRHPAGPGPQAVETAGSGGRRPGRRSPRRGAARGPDPGQAGPLCRRGGGRGGGQAGRCPGGRRWPRSKGSWATCRMRWWQKPGCATRWRPTAPPARPWWPASW